jgi:hypothetical protein
MGLALVAAALAQGSPARGQSMGQYTPIIPSPVGAARIMPEPLPCGASEAPPPPNLVPGPVSPVAAPMGPPNCLDLPADHSSAFQCENYPQEVAGYFHPGVQWLQRQRLGAGAIAVFDNGTPGQLLTPAESQLIRSLVGDASQLIATLPPNVQRVVLNELARLGITNQGDAIRLIDQIAAAERRNLKSGLAAERSAGIALQNNNLVPQMDIGVRGTIGFLIGGDALEYTSYFVFQDNRSAGRSLPDGLDLFFFNAPPGFRGDGNLFLQADRVQMTFGSSLWNNELNFRSWNVALTGFDVLVGLRYVEERENLSILDDHDGRTGRLDDGSVDRRNVALYEVDTRNHVLAPQLGMEYNLSVFRWLNVGWSAKGAWGINFAESEVKLLRGDGFLGFDSPHFSNAFSQIYDLGAFVDLCPLERLRIRAGYNAVWLTGLATAPDQIQFNLKGDAGGRDVLPAFNTPIGAFETVLRRLLAREIDQLNEANINAVRNIPHGRGRDDGSLLFHGPMVELQFLF